MLHYEMICANIATLIALEGSSMTTAVRVSDKLAREAKLYSKVDNRSVTGQIEHWAKIGKCAEENPELTYSLIKEILIGLEELEQGESSEYKFG
jgi:hypothetical protein